MTGIAVSAKQPSTVSEQSLRRPWKRFRGSSCPKNRPRPMSGGWTGKFCFCGVAWSSRAGRTRWPASSAPRRPVRPARSQPSSVSPAFGPALARCTAGCPATVTACPEARLRVPYRRAPVEGSGSSSSKGSVVRRTPTCVLSDAAPPDVSDGHAVDRFVEIGSLTKVVTGTALARMATSGVVGLDDPLERWLPATPRTGITLLHLAQHTSGLPRLPPRVSRRDPYATFDRRAVHQLLSRLDAIAARPPGRQEEYSNLGYAILGEALATAAGTTYEELVTEYVLRPLDIAEVTANPDPSRRLPPRGASGGPAGRGPCTVRSCPQGDCGPPPRGSRSGRTPPGGTPTGGSRAVLADRRHPALAQRRDARRLGLRRGDGRRPLGTDPPTQRSTRGNGPGRRRAARATPNRFLMRRPSRWRVTGEDETSARHADVLVRARESVGVTGHA